MRNVYFQRFWFELYGIMNGSNSFSLVTLKPGFHKMDIMMTSPVRATNLKRFIVDSRIQWCLHWLSSSFSSGVMPNHNEGVKRQ